MGTRRRRKLQAASPQAASPQPVPPQPPRTNIWGLLYAAIQSNGTASRFIAIAIVGFLGVALLAYIPILALEHMKGITLRVVLPTGLVSGAAIAVAISAGIARRTRSRSDRSDSASDD